MSFQATLAGPDGTLLGSGTRGAVNQPMVFRIYSLNTGGTLLWSEQQTVTVDNGSLNVVLGEGNSFANEPRPALSSVFQASDASDRFIEMTFRATSEGETDMTILPRIRLLPGASSLLATRARTATDLVNGNSAAVLRTVGSRVGVNTSNPQQALDVTGSLAAREWAVAQDLTVTGSGEAAGFNGLGMAPVGSILMWTGSTPPMGWVLCDGAVVGGVATPDLRGRFVLAAGGGQGLITRDRGDVGGLESHALPELQMPAHSHSVTFSGTSMENNPGGSHLYRGNTAPGRFDYVFPYMDLGDRSEVNVNPGNMTTSLAGGHRHTGYLQPLKSSDTGAGEPHPNMPPFYVLAFIMRVR